MPDNNLPELRDIHLPDGVSAFPPAYGWWIVVAAIIGILFLIWIGKIIHRKSRKLYALYLLQSIHNLNPVAAAIEMSAVLRRICVYKYPEAITLSGADWLNFINAKTKQPLEAKAAELLINAPYIRKNSPNFSSEDAEILRSFCRKWVGENL